ncbi:uncharacterized protein KD926_000254 [Aspergillus affinis]|uniref:uncharacterized protein n=1 Tax=Aspergillus affinis TaxID=1070780 RepID=UPI0022FF1531|nr:uncharacterized protein KD926_000254 [Aspergillus affinis]KAI9037534.1 hypothetical protein KD926_000254 [Aspergillus affinis]
MPFLLCAIKTLATALRHHDHGNELYQATILKMYCDSLELVGKALKGAQGAFDTEHSIAIMCLAVTDIIIPKLESGWMTHVKGLGDIAEHLGPEPFSSGIWHTLFIGFRPLLLISSILNRRKTFLAREEWNTTPFRGQTVSMMQLLLNKASELPILLERYYEIGELADASKNVVIEQLCKDFRNFVKRLRDWELSVRSRAPSPLFWLRPNPKNISPSYGNVLWFPSIMVASSLTHYWAFEIIARQHLNILSRAITANTGCIDQGCVKTLTGSTGEKPVEALAEMICDSMPYLMQPEMRLCGPGSAFFTLTTAIQVFRSKEDQDSFQLFRCQQIVDRLANIGIHFPVI